MPLDGDLSPWQDAGCIRFDASALDGRPRSAAVHALWDDTNLYLAFDVHSTKLQAAVREHDGDELWMDDGVEFLIDPRRDRTKLFLPDDVAYHINILNVVYDDRGTPAGQPDPRWNGAAAHAVRIVDDYHYVVEAAVPWLELGIEPREGVSIGIDFCVNSRHPATGEYVYYDWCGLPLFHDPSGFGELVLGGPVTGQELYRRARARIPGGTQLLSKRPEMHLPEGWPAYYSRAEGAEITGIDGRRYIDMSYAGIGACVLGYADRDVNEAVHAAVDAGSMASLNCAEEVELADLLCDLHPWADMVRYARGGGEAMAVAVRIARAHTRRAKVAFCGYHGWHDWYLAANLLGETALEGHLLPGLDPAGVPGGLAGTALPFHYNRLDQLQEIAAANAGELAAIVMEPVRQHEPEPGFLEGVRRLAREAGAVLVFDEVTAAFRANTGGVHLRYGVTPDIAVFAKAISNGYPMAAIIGRGEVMRAAQDSFISSTYWTERIGPAAALATIRKHRRCDVPLHLERAGRLVQEGWRAAATRTGLPVEVSGMPALGHFSLQTEDAQAVRTLFTQMMLDRGFLATNAYYAMYAHQESHIVAYLAAVEEVFAALAGAIERGEVRTLLRGPVAHAGFYRLT